MARTNSRKVSRRRNWTISTATVAGFVPLIARLPDGYRSNGIEGVADRVSMAFTGYSFQSKNWYLARLKEGWLYPGLGVLAHKMANRIGLNAVIARAGIPFIRV